VPRRLEKWEWTFVRVLSVVVLVVVVGAVYVWYAHSPFRAREHPLTLEQLSSTTGLAFPRGARLMRSRLITYWVSSHMWAEVTIPRRDVETFEQAAAKGTKVEWSEGFRMTRIVDPDLERAGVNPPAWWHPELVTNGIGGRGHMLDGFFEVLIAQEPEDPATILVQWIH
jgi:hypothetical protein